MKERTDEPKLRIERYRIELYIRKGEMEKNNRFTKKRSHFEFLPLSKLPSLLDESCLHAR